MKIVDHFYSAIDCADPDKLAQFYSAITGLRIDLTNENTESEIVWIELKDNEGIPKLAFQKISNYKAPTWPEGLIPQQIHLDFAVKDLDEAEEELLKIGAIKTDFQPGSPKSNDYSTEFRVYLDPEGHPFCIIHRP
jgi:hypothetical protein